MKSKKSFATIFTDTENFHLVKDVGQIPYFMYKTGAYEAELVTYQNNPEYSYLEKEVRGLKMVFIANTGRFLYAEKGVLKYLRSASKKIDVLHLFHFKKDNILYLLLYKNLNPKGKVYVKLDMDILFFKDYDRFFYSEYRVKNYLLKALTKLHFKLVDLFSVETDEAREYLLTVYPELEKKLMCIPNGIDNLYIHQNIRIKPFEEKENIMITAGRIGTVQKNTGLFLESLRLADLKDWKVYVLGPVEETFKPVIQRYFDINPDLKNKVIFTGNITNRLELLEWYNRAKIFCMTSRFEGFPISFAEALYFGNYIISTPVSSASFVTDHGRLGIVAEADPASFAEAIETALSGISLNKDLYQHIRTFADKHITWPEIIKRIVDHLEK